MKIIVLSDTHGNQKFLRKALNNESGFNYIFHLGDNYEDIEFNEDVVKAAEIVRVPGIYHTGYIRKTIPHIQSKTVCDIVFQLVHNINDIKQVSSETDVILFGHTHHPLFEVEDNVCFMNPGHLKDYSHRGSDASYLVLNIEYPSVKVYFKNLDGTVRRQEQFEIVK